jgi:hypothetical protein
MGNAFAGKDKKIPHFAGREKHVESLKNQVAITTNYYTDSRKKTAHFMGDSAKKNEYSGMLAYVKKEMSNTPNKENNSNETDIIAEGKAEKILPEKRSRSILKSPKSSYYIADLIKPDQLLLSSIEIWVRNILELLCEEKDERYIYLIKHGNVAYVEAETYTLFVELPQIPNVMIAYRRPAERTKAKRQ